MAKEKDKVKSGQRPELQVEKRTVFGRKVKTLRRQEILPANIYGKKVKSQAVQLGLKPFLLVYQEVGETGLVDLKVKGEPKPRPVLIHNVQSQPVDGSPLHADFYQVDLTQKITTEIPVETVGESVAVKEKGGVLIQPLAEVEVEALPAELPDKFEIDLGGLKEIGDMIKVGDLKAPKGVKILTSEGEVLAKVEPPTKEEVAPPPTEAPAEAEVPVEEAKEEGKPAEKKPGEKKVEAPIEGKKEEVKSMGEKAAEKQEGQPKEVGKKKK